MAGKRDTKAMKRGKKVKDLRVKGASNRRAGVVRGGSPTIEIKDFSFGVENPTHIGSGTGGTSPGKVSFNGLNIKKP